MAKIYDLKPECRFVQTNDPNFGTYPQGAVVYKDKGAYVYCTLSESAAFLVTVMFPHGATENQLIKAAQAAYPAEKEVPKKVNAFLNNPLAQNFLTSVQDPAAPNEHLFKYKETPSLGEMPDPTVTPPPEEGVVKSEFSVTGYIGSQIIGGKY